MLFVYTYLEKQHFLQTLSYNFLPWWIADTFAFVFPVEIYSLWFFITFFIYV
jgi:hypothetical protein